MKALGLLLLMAGVMSCRKTPGTNSEIGATHDDPPVALDPQPLVEYPPALYQQGIEGTVILRLFVNEQGTVVRESTQVAQSSGYPAFDSAAMAGVPRMRFAPAQRDGRPVATAFTQPVHFRRPQTEGAPQ
jgi:protein TonB